MIVIRPIKSQDVPIFAEFSFESLLGITNLPRDRDKLLEKTLRTESFLNQEIEKPGLEEYFFVLEDLATKRIGGVCGILASSCMSREFMYKVESTALNSKHIAAPKEMLVLKPGVNPCQASEVCSLYLQPTFRHSGQGRLLSLSRFLFIAAHRKRFKSKIVAELRGYIDNRQMSPFWEGIGSHFCKLSFVEIMAQLDQDRTFISEILPKYPIYIDLLPKDVQEMIGKCHDGSKPAMKMLIDEGFATTSEIDVFDGGPTLMANTSAIRSIKNSAVVKVQLTKEVLEEETEYILGNEKLDYRACYGKLKFNNKNHAFINQEIAETLIINEGDSIRYITPH